MEFSNSVDKLCKYVSYVFVKVCRHKCVYVGCVCAVVVAVKPSLKGPVGRVTIEAMNLCRSPQLETAANPRQGTPSPSCLTRRHASSISGISHKLIAFKAGTSAQHVGGPWSCPEAEEWVERVIAVWSSDAGIWSSVSGVFFYSKRAKNYYFSITLQVYVRACGDPGKNISFPCLSLKYRGTKKLKRWKSKCQLYFW